MTAPNGHFEPTETSPLIGKDVSTTIENVSNPLPTDSSQALPSRLADGPQRDGAEDEETGEVEEPENQLFEGLPEVAARLHILAPAVAIGASLAIQSLVLITTS